jgi:hypothetical protein
MDNEELRRLPLLEWMPSRIPLRDALVTLVPPGGEQFPKEKIPESSESRCFPQDMAACAYWFPTMAKRSTRHCFT